MERFPFPQEPHDVVALAQEIANKKIAAHEAAVATTSILQVDCITSLLQIVVGHALPFL